MSNLRVANYTYACLYDEWKDIIGYEGLYEVNKRGYVRNAVTKKLLRAGLGGVGYLTVSLTKDKLRKSFSVHRLVAIHYYDNPENKPMVNHKDGIKTNNHYVNLEWCTRSENELHAHAIGLKHTPNPARGLIQMDMDGNVVASFKSTIEAETYGFRSGNIACVCNGKRISHKGFKWAYINK